jgi:hypothetical protein
MEFDLRWLQHTIARHLPDFYLHHDDPYLPCSAEYFMHNSELWGRHPDGSNVIFATRGSLSGTVLRQFQDDYPHHQLWMKLDPDARLGQPLDQLQDVPVYAHVKAILSRQDTDKIEALEITYITLFAYNGDYEVIPGLIRTGAHDGDIEHITARVHPQSGDLITMWYNSHRSRDGQWVPAAQVPKSSTSTNTWGGGGAERHAAYIAKHGHGNYPSVGTVHRHFFLGNDTCSNTGPVWRPKTVVLLPPHYEVCDGATKEKIQESRNLRRRVCCTPSRGCSLSSEANEIEMEVQGSAVVNRGGGGGGGGGLISLSKGNTDGNPGCFPRVITTDLCEWIHFKGKWGQADAPICQNWYHQAETPVSRTAFQRIFLHLWPETESI